MSTDTLSLDERIEAVLVAAGFPKYNGTSEARSPHFTLAAGVGVIVGIAWRDAPDGERAALLVKYENRLVANGLDVANRGKHLYVADPDRPADFGMLVNCAEPDCPQMNFVECASVRERAAAVSDQEADPWHCTEHAAPTSTADPVADLRSAAALIRKQHGVTPDAQTDKFWRLLAGLFDDATSFPDRQRPKTGGDWAWWNDTVSAARNYLDAGGIGL